jgi:DNA polymerase III delta subunit
MRRFGSFLADVARGARAGYVLAGPEAFLRDEAERAVVRAVFGPGENAGGFVPLDGERSEPPLELADVLDELRGVSLLAERKVVAVRRADALARQHAAALADYLEHPDPDSALVLHVETWDRRSAWARKLDGFAVDCSAPYETAFGETEVTPGSPLVRWLRESARERRKLAVAPDAAVRMVELVGTNLSELDGALERIALALGGGRGTVTRELVDANVAPSRSYTQFRVAELLTEGKTRAALEAADACFEHGLAERAGRTRHNEAGIAESIIAAVAQRLERLYVVKGFVEEGAFDRSAAGSLGIPPFRADAVAEAARSMAFEVVERALELALEAARSAHSGAGGRLTVEKLVLELGRLVSAGEARDGRRRA